MKCQRNQNFYSFVIEEVGLMITKVKAAGVKPRVKQINDGSSSCQHWFGMERREEELGIIVVTDLLAVCLLLVTFESVLNMRPLLYV